MNNDLLHLYKSLPTIVKQSLPRLFHDSPKTLLLAQFLDTERDADFKTSKAVNFIYRDEMASDDAPTYAVLVNRFYKLRQTFRQWLLTQFKNNELTCPSVEQELIFVRMLMAKNELTYALDTLERLSSQCRAYFLYEFLPEIEDLCLLCMQSLNPYDVALLATYEQRLAEANAHEQALRQLVYWYRRSFLNDSLTESLDQIRKICTKNPTNTRFQLIYRMTAFSRGVTHPELASKSRHVLVRHLNELTQLMEANPQIPIIGTALCADERIRYNLELLKSSFYIMGGDFRTALHCIEKRAQMEAASPYLAESKSLAYFRNELIVYLLNERYEQAVEAALAYKAFCLHIQPHQPPFAWLELAHCYIQGAAVLRPSADTLREVLRGVRQLMECDLPTQFNVLEAQSAYWWLLVIAGRREQALAWLATQGEACLYFQLQLAAERLVTSEFVAVLRCPSMEAIRDYRALAQEQTGQCSMMVQHSIKVLLWVLEQLEEELMVV